MPKCLQYAKKICKINTYLFYIYRKEKENQSWTLTFKKTFAKLKFSPVFFEKIPSFACLVFKI